MNATKTRRGGFTLVEVSLALLVLVVGILGAFALFPHALVESKKATDESQASMFAESVFQSVRAYAQMQWDALDGTVEIPGPGSRGVSPDPPSVWANSPNIVINGGEQTYECRASGFTTTDAGLRYRLAVTRPMVQQSPVLQRISPFMRIVTLTIWPGLYGDTPDIPVDSVPSVSTYVYVSAVYKDGYFP